MIATIVPETHSLSAILSDVVGGQGHKTQSRYGVELHLKLTVKGKGNLVGLGEASPIPGYSRDTLDRVSATLSGLEPFPLSLPQNAQEARATIEELSAKIPENEPSARFALESALVDLLSQHLGLSSAILLAQMAEQPEGPADKLALSRLLPSTDLTECLALARHAWSRGYRVFKLKIGGGEKLQLGFSALRMLREKFGQEAKLRVDPNGTWQKDELPQILTELAEFQPELLEEPCPLHELVNLEKNPIPLALDESLLESNALALLAPHRERLNWRAIVVKPALLGLMRALELCGTARKMGLDVIVTHLFDGPVGHASALCLALAIGSRHRAHGLAPHPGLLLSPNRRIEGLGQGLLIHENRAGLPLVQVR